MSIRDIYAMLESPNPGFLKSGVIRDAQSNGVYTELLRNPPDAQLLGLEMARLRVFLRSQQRILKKEKHPTNKAGEEAQLVSSFSPYATREITILAQAWVQS